MSHEHVEVVLPGGRGGKGGVEVARAWAYVWMLRERKALRVGGSETRPGAFEAVGLEE